MKPVLFLLTPVLPLAAAALLMGSHPAPGLTASSDDLPRVPVVVELFTSEGCSSCPAADAALRELETAHSVPGVEVIALGQHVDYWNRLGWKDAFSSSQFTERQRDYAAGFGTGSYTPQVVVNGRYEFVGSQRAKLADAIARAARAPRATVVLSRPSPGTLGISVSHLPAGTAPTEVLLALTETGLSSQVGRGENAGRLLRHAAVVRALRPLGSPAADGTFATTTPLQINPIWKTQNLRAVVLVQEKVSHRIVGVAALPLNEAARQ
ncbi:DUF1223 domain-containing protein [Hymenobacter amundsenii]|uniref:DUF1223 domain-containing protein n=1 Tax=Hymenobacter amundsenii TaxID=2006685 RepID=A0A246FH35_9BACT|nr:DUF1223 domain-containing protein [Hymenobacter amundsenii]OWP61847.1 DUF1223 domain-containing protein [Hymenobacter amundsenii]